MIPLKEMREIFKRLQIETYDSFYKIGKCRICGEIFNELDKHHIISQPGRGTVPDWIIDSPGNVVYICRNCHKQTTSWLMRKQIKRRRFLKK